jgi:uncharacterized protein (DUF2062 family)
LQEAHVLRKFFRKFPRSAESIREHPFIGRLGTVLHHPNLWHVNRHSVAGGVAAGLFAGLIPGSNPVQFTAAAIAAVIFRVNLPVAMFVTLYSNPFTIVPLYFFAYKIGAFFLEHSNNHLPQTEIDVWDVPLAQWVPVLINWAMAMGKPLALGLVILAGLLAAVGFIAVHLAWHGYILWRWRKRKQQRAHSR